MSSHFNLHRGVDDPALWAGEVGNSWRTTDDINDSWARSALYTLFSFYVIMTLAFSYCSTYLPYILDKTMFSLKS